MNQKIKSIIDKMPTEGWKISWTRLIRRATNTCPINSCGKLVGEKWSGSSRAVEHGEMIGLTLHESGMIMDAADCKAIFLPDDQRQIRCYMFKRFNLPMEYY